MCNFLLWIYIFLVSEEPKLSLYYQIVLSLYKTTHLHLSQSAKFYDLCIYFYPICPISFPCGIVTNSMVITTVSQIEHGVLHLVDSENSTITVLVDCEGLSPLKIPMQMLRSCSYLLQDHFPNRLGCLFVIRLPPVVRVIAKTFIQVSLFRLVFKCLMFLLFSFSCMSFVLISNLWLFLRF